MKKLVLLPALALMSVFSTIQLGCDGSNITECETDEDCADLPDTPTCGEEEGFCVASEGEGEDEPECTTDEQCQATDIGSDDTCDSDDDCGGDACVEASDGENHCVARTDGLCEDFGGFDITEVTGENADGGDEAFCADADVACDDGTCTGGVFE